MRAASRARPARSCSAGVDELVAAGAGNRLHGPAADTDWRVTGEGSGVVAGQRFRGFGALVGASGNRDSFTVTGGGFIGSVDGGAGGYDVLTMNGHRS